jgi:hypothetical protein
VGDGGAEAHAIEFVWARTQADFYVGQAFPVSDLSEGHGQELIPAREAADPMVAVVAVDTTAKLFAMNPVHDLTENRLFGSHWASLALPVLQKTPIGVEIDHIVFVLHQAHLQILTTISASLNRMTVNQFVLNQLLARARKLAAHCPNVQCIWYYAVIHINDEMKQSLLQQKFVPMFSKGRVFYNEFPTPRPDGTIALTPTFVLSFDAIVVSGQ